MTAPRQAFEEMYVKTYMQVLWMRKDCGDSLQVEEME